MASNHHAWQFQKKQAKFHPHPSLLSRVFHEYVAMSPRVLAVCNQCVLPSTRIRFHQNEQPKTEESSLWLPVQKLQLRSKSLCMID